MGEEKLKKWQELKRARQEAESWQSLPKGRRYSASKFEISIAHCRVPMLNRMGQQVCGGQAYWEASPEFNTAILETIVEEWDTFGDLVIKKMKADLTMTL